MKNHPFQVVLFLILILTVSCTTKLIQAPNNLVVSEGFTNPIGFYDVNPTFSWELPLNGNTKSQIKYELVVASRSDLLPSKADLWETGKVKSSQSVWVKYNGKPLVSKQKVYWQVRFWNQDGKASAWSKVAHFELGLLQNADWQAKWISLPDEVQPLKEEYGTILHKPQFLRKEFAVKSELKQARLYVSARGIFQAHLNGVKIGDDVMTPGFTLYKKFIETLTYDVTDMVSKGKNALGLYVGSGWYSGRLGWDQKQWVVKPKPQGICQLELIYANGEKDVIVSDEQWKGTRNGPIVFSDYYDGELYDANLELGDWNKVGYDTESWTSVLTEDLNPEIKLVPKRHNTVTIKTQVRPIAITEPKKGAFVFDMGQNMVGVPKLYIPVKKDQKVTIRFAEMLNKDGSMFTENYRSAKSTDYYIPKEDGIVSWQPTFTFHGFRYVELSGFDTAETPTENWVSGLVYYSDFGQTGKFTSSHAKLNQLQSNIEWGMRGNFLDIPTDCPQRDERLGWTGDAQVFAPTSMFIGDVHSFWMSWLQSMRADQDNEGGIPFVVPNHMGKTFSSGWADAATVIPWEIYFRTGDIGVLEENYEMMRKLVSYYTSKSKNYIVNVNTFGDWLQPFPIEEGNQRGDTPKDLIGTAYYARSVDLTKKAAEVLGKDADVKELETLFKNVCEAFEKKYFDENGKLTTPHESQTGYLMALGFNLVSETIKPMVLNNLLNQLKEADYHLRTGFLGTPLLAPVLDNNGLAEIMYKILFKETYPSWFYSINQGATTMWERWDSYTLEDGFNKGGMNSFNHYAYGAIGQWMYERIAGIQPIEPGYKKIRIAPLTGGPLTHAKAEYASIFGKICSQWTKTDSGLELKVTVPPNTSAIVELPLIENTQIFLDGIKFEGNQDAKLIETTNETQVLEVEPGTFTFTLK